MDRIEFYRAMAAKQHQSFRRYKLVRKAAKLLRELRVDRAGADRLLRQLKFPDEFRREVLRVRNDR